MFGGSQEALGSAAYPTHYNSDFTFEIGYFVWGHDQRKDCAIRRGKKTSLDCSAERERERESPGTKCFLLNSRASRRGSESQRN